VKSALAILTVFLILLIQSVLIPYIRILNVIPDLLFIWLIFRSGSINAWQGALLGFFCGLLQDLTLGGMAGIFAFSKTLAGFLSAWIPWRPQERNPLMAAMVLLGVGLIHQILAFGLGSITSSAGFIPMFLRYGVPAMVYTTVAGFMIYMLNEGWRWLRKGH
jgi:rod shape-determining protein MreD